VTLPPVDGIRVGFARSFFTEGLDAAVAGGVETCQQLLSGTAAATTGVALPDLSVVGELANIVAMSEAAGIHFDWLRSRPQDYGPQVGARLSQGLALPAPVYIRALQMRARLLREFLDTVFSACDVLIVPTMPFLPPLASEMDVGDGTAMNSMLSDMTRFTRPVSFLGLPVVSLPVAMAGGLPVGVQVVAAPFREDAAAAVALFLEQALCLPGLAPATATERPAGTVRAKTSEAAL
ncbi:MAG: amidase family protein, partial [Rhizobium sp.]